MKNVTQCFRAQLLLCALIFSTSIFSQTIDFEDFESGWGIWNDGGIDCQRRTTGTPNGTDSMRLRDNEGVASASTTDNINLTPYVSVDFTFDYEAVSMESGEDFFIRYSPDGGTNWSTIATYTRGTDFNNNTTYTETITLDSGTYTFATNSRFRIQCDAGDNGDYVYIDNIRISGTTDIANFGPGGLWNYQDDGSNQGTAWRASSFDDSSWSSGNAELGFGDGDETTVMNNTSTEITYYFRKDVFVTTSEAAETNLIFEAIRDDGIVIYVNGTEVLRDNMPGGTINYNTVSSGTIAGGAESTWNVFSLANVLVAGTNTIAVEVHQRSAGSSDLSFNLDMRVASPEINITGNSNSIADGDITPAVSDDTEFGTVTVGSNTDHTFTIENTGDSGTTLNLTGGPLVSISGSSAFSIFTQPSGSTITGGNSDTFVIRFNPIAASTVTATVSIANDDSDENPYTFVVQGTGAASGSKEINILGNSNTITDGSTTTSIVDDTEFYSPDISTNVTHTFTIQNLGSGATTINLTGGPIVAISGDSEFSISAQPATTAITGGTFTTFDVTFNPTDENWKTAVVSIANDDSDENPYTFTVKGNVSNIDNFGFGGEWKYLDTAVDQGTTWKDTTFDDSSWSSGDAELGFGDGDETTAITDNSQPTTYFRKAFYATAADVSASNLFLDLLYDDGAVVYLNGTEIWRVNMPTGSIAYSTYASGDPGDNATANTLIANALVTGTNIIAVEIHQRNGSSTDISFDFDIETRNYNIFAGWGEWKYLDDGSDQGTTWTGTGFDDSSWASGDAELGYGDGDETTTVSYGPSSSNKYPTTYFRKTFTVSAANAAMNKLHLEMVVDDGAVVYVNGTKVWMFNMPLTYDYTSHANDDLSDDDEPRWWTYELENLLVTGSNTIAVEVHQYSDSSTDISFNFAAYVTNDDVYTPLSLDNDLDTAQDWNDGDDDNDGVPDLIEGCVTADMEDLNTTGSEDVLASFPYTTTLSDGNVITYAVNDINDFNSGNGITSYEAGNHGWGLRVSGADTDGLLTISFATAVDNLFFRLVDFDENEQWTVNVYDDTNTLIDLNTTGIAHLGYNVEQNGNGFNDRLTGDGDNVNGDDVAWDVYSAAYFYFPNDKVSRIEFSTVQNQGSTIRIVGIQYCNKDTDGDGIEDYFDSDSDNDAIPDLVEAGGVDNDGDGIIDSLTDTDKDGLLDAYDLNPNDFLVEDPSKINDYDFDGDGVPNRIDLDSDNDGIVDLREVGENDTDGNGQIDSFTDSNNDGYHDSFDGANSRLITGTDGGTDGIPDTYPNKNQDGTGLPNFSDIDSDDDGITDNTEAQLTGSYVAYGTTDTDGDGVNNVFDNSGSFGGNGLIPIDTDFDCIPDFLDTNSDDDLENDRIEGHDTNNDGTPDSGSNANNGVFTGTDTDGDGLDDGYDNNNGTYTATNQSLQATSHPINDGLYDRDWRASNSPIDFDGINDFVDFGDSNDIAAPNFATGSFSLEAWVLQQSTPASEGTILSKRDAKPGNERGYHLVINSSNRINLAWYNSSGSKVLDITSSYSITNNKWYHIAATYDGTDAKLYIDGLEVATGSTATPPSTGDEKFMVGAMYDSDNCDSATKYFDGYIDEVRIWSEALSPTQIRQMMNQELVKVGENIQGSVIPRNVTGLVWGDLEGYYPMNSNIATDESENSNNGFPKYINTIQSQTAPLPYTTVRDGDWSDNTGTTPWTYGNTVWNLPNSLGVDGSTPINWNIVETDHNIDIDTYTNVGRERHVLGLLVNTNTVTVIGVTDKDALPSPIYTGNGLNVNWYLGLDGKIDLEGESQLIQPDDSDIVVGTSGILEKDQQGTQDLYTYNYWSSPVGFTQTDSGINDTFKYILNNNILKDGTDSANPVNITFVGGYDGSNSGSNIEIAHYWIWKFNNRLSDDYPSWQHVRNTGELLAGEGFTMKGVNDTGGTVSDEQNYVFQGKPNNGKVTVEINAGNDYLVGNPYASAIDAEQFITDNGPLIDGGVDPMVDDPLISGTLYFWEHWGGGSHILAEYQGGYGTYNYSGGSPAASFGDPDPDVAQVGTGTKTPGRYIPVGQGFFVVGEDDGDIEFNNGQRVFQKEGSASSVFMRNSETASRTNNNEDTRMKIRLGFNSVNTIHRQLLVTVDERASEDYDWGFDAKLTEDQIDDMYWMINDEKHIIQGTDVISDYTILPIGIHTDDDGLNRITIDILENVPSDLSIYVHDKELNVYQDLRERDYEIFLEAGEYLDRFEITFTAQSLSVDEFDEAHALQVFYVNSMSSIVIQNPKMVDLKSAEMFNMIGQSITRFNELETKNYLELKTNQLSTGTYIINLKTTDGAVITKKVLVK